jgi:hypothetical protein
VGRGKSRFLGSEIRSSDGQGHDGEAIDEARAETSGSVNTHKLGESAKGVPSDRDALAFFSGRLAGRKNAP